MESLREQFPFFAAHPSCVYLDSSATTQLPQPVIDATASYLTNNHAAVGRGLYTESIKATAAVEETRGVVADFLGADSRADVVFTSGATAALNAIAWGVQNKVKKGDTIVVALDNHHANFLPWQRLARQQGATVIIIPVNTEGTLDANAWQSALQRQPRLVALTHASNVTGTLHPIKQLVAAAHAAGAITVVDGAQAVAHTVVNLDDIGCDFYVFSAHKLYGPTGLGCIVANHDLLCTLDPFIVGGGMIAQVTATEASWADSPTRHEAGTPNTTGIAGLAAAIRWFTANRTAILEHERQLMKYTQNALRTLPDVTVLGSPTTNGRVGVFSFDVAGRHAHDVAQILAEQSVCVRTGHHCAQPLHTHLGYSATTRISLGAYTTAAEIDAATAALTRVCTLIPKR